MRILLVAPHPFYKERGTPIAVKLLVEILCEFGNEIDLLTYHEGTDVNFKGLRLFRIKKPPFCDNIPIGFSLKKIMADIYLTFRMITLLRGYRYDVIHAVEESIFPAVIINFFLKKKLVYDMDSSMSDQLIEKWEGLSKIEGFLNFFEHWAAKHSTVVIAVCKYLAEKINRYNSSIKTFVLEDIAFESESDLDTEDLRKYCSSRTLLVLYVGNLEHYQGIDLALEAISRLNTHINFKLLLIGGTQEHIISYTKKIEDLKIVEKVEFLGPRPLKNLAGYLKQADILISPRLKGINTPMKIYSYLASGIPVIATNITSHTQVMSNEHALLVEANPDEFAKGLKKLIEDENLRVSLGTKGKILADENYSLKSYKVKLKNIYSWIEGLY
jgi:glycosyltransferase involved in cell wall biosynthesis